MKVSDLAISVLRDTHGVTDIFVVSGSGNIHLLESIRAAHGIRYHCVAHEQAAVVAAEGYARESGRLGIAIVTLGPGAANALSGVPGAWVDSIPILVIAGQVPTGSIADYAIERQRGPQEINALDMVRPIVKYAARVNAAADTISQIDLAVEAAISGRPGPAWLEFPVDITALDIDPTECSDTPLPALSQYDDDELLAKADLVADAICESRRPLLIAGNGIRASGGYEHFIEAIGTIRIPVVVPFTAKDIIPEDHPCNMGVFGTAGQRRANFAVQNADLVIGLAAGLNIQKMGPDTTDFARNAKKILVDIDPQQSQCRVLGVDISICADISRFLPILQYVMRQREFRVEQDWIHACNAWKKRYPIITDDYTMQSSEKQMVNSYLFVDALSDMVQEDDTIVTGVGLDAVSTYQAFRVRRGQRILISGWGSMGWDIPLAIGAAIARNKRVIVVTGDGSIQCNLQELLTVQRYDIPLKIFVLNNYGFSTIRAIQNTLFEGRFTGSEYLSGIGALDFRALALTYKMGYTKIDRPYALGSTIRGFLSDPSPGIAEVLIHHEQAISPKLSVSRSPDGHRPLEDMAPFLSRDEMDRNILPAP